MGIYIFLNLTGVSGLKGRFIQLFKKFIQWYRSIDFRRLKNYNLFKENFDKFVDKTREGLCSTVEMHFWQNLQHRLLSWDDKSFGCQITRNIQARAHEINKI